MSLSQKQRDKAVELALKKVLSEGIPPSSAKIDTITEQLLPTILGEPSFKFRQQPRRGNFRIQDQNAMFTEAANDLSVLYEENIETLERLLGHLALLEVQGRRYSSEIRMLQKYLEDLLLTSERATNFFFAVGDTFVDIRDVDQSRSTVALDVGAGLVTLAPDSRSAKIPLAHLLEQQTGLVRVLPLSATGRQVPGTKFGNAFEDTLTAWQYQVLTENQEPVELNIVIPISAVGEAAKLVSRITLQSPTATPYSVLPLWSSNGTAFSLFGGLSEPRLFVDEFAVLDVSEQYATHIQLKIRKAGPDGEDQIEVPVDIGKNNKTRLETRKMFSTLFSFKNIGIWSMGFRRNGVLVSKTLTPQDSESMETIGKATLTVNEEVPLGTSIRYEIASNLEPEVFIPISPLNSSNTIAPQVVDFTTVQRSPKDDNTFTVDSANTPTSLGTIRGTEFFSIKTVSDTVLDKTARLWRGLNAWACQREVNTTIVQIRNLLVDFSGSDTQRLYVFEEDERIVSHPSNDGTAAIKLKTRFPILLEGDKFNPSQDLRSPSDTAKPNFAIRKLIRRPVPGTINQAKISGSTVSVTAVAGSATSQSDSQPGSPTAGRSGAEVTITNFSSGGLLATSSAGSVPDLFGSKFRLTYTNNSLVVTGVFTITAAQLASSGTLTLTLDDPTEILETTSAAASVAWEVLEVNITPHITEVAGNELTLAEEQKLETDDILEISYRRGLLPSESPLTSTIIVKSTTGGETVYSEGTDYVIDQNSRTLTRVATGSIQRAADDASIAVLVDFDYEARYLNLVTYKTYVFVPETTPKIRIAKIVIDREHGEEILLEAPNGFIDLQDRTDIPPLNTGWHQIVVRSNPIYKDDGTIDTSSAIYKAINIKELRTETDTGRFIMPALRHPEASGSFGNKFANYFTKQTAFLQAMTQIPFRQLTTSVRKTDKTVFAIKEASESPTTATAVVAVNFDPQDSLDILYMPPDILGTEIPLSREDFAIEYAYIPTGADTITGVKLRATFMRDPNASGSVTPILYNYSVRLAY